MYEFIVLGLVPGTQIQINYEVWQQIIAGLCTAIVLWRVHRSHIIRNSIITLWLAFLVRRPYSSFSA